VLVIRCLVLRIQFRLFAFEPTLPALQELMTAAPALAVTVSLLDFRDSILPVH